MDESRKIMADIEANSAERPFYVAPMRWGKNSFFALRKKAAEEFKATLNRTERRIYNNALSQMGTTPAEQIVKSMEWQLRIAKLNEGLGK